MSADNIKQIIAVASGKGGVGKSTTAVNLAIALSLEGKTVGLLDADIYGPNQPHMLGTHAARPTTNADKKLEPVRAHGIQSMSIGYLVEPETALVWRGPMATGALQQLFNDTAWKDLDYLVIDLPPGTGDIQLTLAQKIPVTAAIIVTTPQDVALLDVRKAVNMFEKVHVPILGVIENMSLHTCSQCGHTEAIFGEGGAEKISKTMQTKLLGQLLLDIKIREQADAGKPIIVANPDHAASKIYRDIAKQVIEELKSRFKKTKFPKIVIENK